MPNLLAMSFEGELAPSFDLRCLQPGQSLPDGWGLGYYPAGEPSASVLKEPAPPRGSIRGELVKAWEHLESSLFVLHVRTAMWGPNTDANTQPFVRCWAGREWMIGHAGSLTSSLDEKFEPAFEPVGATDTEIVFCGLLARIAARGWRSLAEADPRILHRWLLDLNTRGGLDLVLCDGSDLIAYADRYSPRRLLLAELRPPYVGVAFGDADVRIDLTRRGSKPRKGCVISSSPLNNEGSGAPLSWRRLAPGELVSLRQGAVVGDLLADETPGTAPAPAVSLPPTRPERREGARKPRTRLSTTHQTRYRYALPVERSTHLLRLFPMQDRLQRLMECDVSVSVEGRAHDFDDVFGNRARRVVIETPYRELTIIARSSVETLDSDPLAFDLRHVRSAIPLVWMPWQRHMLQPFLQPPELPESELMELLDYAMRFVHRNQGDLLDTLLDLNDAIHREYTYVQGATTLGTTAFDVYTRRRGVCQDFTNLFICLARLMGVPARYVCGYILTKPKDANQRQAEASHAWVQVYLPEVGWRGLDPTNGTVTSTHHVRLAVGRNYLDATPTSGTIYVGGGGETLDVEVRVERME
ncbi:MAG: class II glutamine amidotransferase [Polyangiaceae bacterium]|jgi:transglutaminase-like putative cysteine protease/predicted glutamine amidotransferase